MAMGHGGPMAHNLTSARAAFATFIPLVQLFCNEKPAGQLFFSEVQTYFIVIHITILTGDIVKLLLGTLW